MRKLILFAVMITGLLAGQSRDVEYREAGESTIWQKTTEDSSHFFKPDTLYQVAITDKRTSKGKLRWTGFGIALVSGLAAAEYHRQADGAYEAYLHSGDTGNLDALFAQAEQLDRRAGLAYVGVEAGLLLFAYSFYR